MLQRSNGKCLYTFFVRPFGFPGPVVIQHIRMWDQRGGPYIVDTEPKVP